MARPTKLTAELTAKIVKAVERGNYAETAAEAAGINVATFYNWMKWGREKRRPYSAFFEAITCARARAEVKLVDTVQRGDTKGTGFGRARAAAFLLERTRPDKFAQRVNLKVKDAVEEVLECVRRVCSEADYAAVLEELSRRGGDDEAEATPSGGPPSLH
jgi:hypothetical protein